MTQVRQECDMNYTGATQVRHERHECDTSATGVLHERHKCDTSATRMTRVRHKLPYDSFPCQNAFEKFTTKTELCNGKSYIKKLHTRL